MNVFESNAALLRDLHAAIKNTFARRNDGESQWKAWEEACQRFHTSYDALAFPGGIGKAMSLLEKSDPSTIEMVVRFLEADPWFFRSGYLKADMLKHLRRAPLSEDQRKRLQEVILDQIRGRHTSREFRWYCRLARFVSEFDFERQVADLAGPSGSIPKRAQWVLDQLKAAQRSMPIAVDRTRK